MSVNLVSRNGALGDYLGRLNEKYVIEKAQLESIESEWNKRKAMFYQVYASQDKIDRDKDFALWESRNLLPARTAVESTLKLIQVIEQQISRNIVRRHSVS